MQQNRQQANVQRRKKKKRQQAIARLVVFLAMVVLLFVAALLFVQLSKQNKPAESVPSSASEPVSSKPSSSEPSSSSVASSSSRPELPQATGEFDVSGLPILLNASHLIPENYNPDPIDVGNGQSLNREAAAAYKAMQSAAKKDGVNLVSYSGYRSHNRQLNNYNSSIDRYIKQGKSREEAERLTQEYYAIPGSSEHEAGLAMDIESVQESFENTKAFEWLQDNSVDYGFIMRYPKDKQSVTGIAYEPWHYRYVGVNHAKEMQKLKITTLEEYWEYFDQEPENKIVSSSTGSAFNAFSSKSSK